MSQSTGIMRHSRSETPNFSAGIARMGRIGFQKNGVLVLHTKTVAVEFFLSEVSISDRWGEYRPMRTMGLYHPLMMMKQLEGVSVYSPPAPLYPWKTAPICENLDHLNQEFWRAGKFHNISAPKTQRLESNSTFQGLSESAIREWNTRRTSEK